MKKALSILLVAGLLTAALTGMATGSTDDYATPEPLPYYLNISGTIVSIEEIEGEEGLLRVNIEDIDGNPAALIVNDNTVFPFEDELSVGDSVTAFYTANAPMILIWPPQYNCAVLVAGMPDDLNIKVDRFFTQEEMPEGFMLDKGGTFAFRVDENTEIILANGDDFSDGDIEGRRLVVIYGVSTRSIPEQATAIKVIVLYEDAVALAEALPEGLLDGFAIDASGWPILIDGVEIKAPAAVQTEDGIVMLPLRATAETLGYKVHWDGATRSVRLGDAITLWIGNAEVRVAATAPLTISTAPQLIAGFTYVPLDFFRDVLAMANAFAFEGQIEIHTEGEPFE